MFLFINTAEDNKTEVALIKIEKNDKVKVIKRISSKTKSDKALILVDKLLKSNKVTPKKLKGVFVIKGPGPFTAVRIAIALANTFSYALNIPVFGVKFVKDEKIEELIKKEIKNIKNIKPGKIVKPIENI
jgi:tRNA threonylcarbamoyl adenosine modification protein YeaZ